MYFFILPVLFFVFISFVIAIPMSVRRKQMAARAERANPEQTLSRGQQAQPNAPVRPTVQPRVQKPVSKTNLAPRFPMEGPPPVQKKTPEEPIAKPVSQPKQQSALSFTGSDAMRGILYAEILGKPKALRKT